MLFSLLTGSLLVAHVLAQSTVSATAASTTPPSSRTSLVPASTSGSVLTINGVTESLSAIENATALVPTGSYMDFTTTRLLTTSSSSAINNSSATGLSNGTTTRSSSTSNSFLLQGTGRASSGTGTASVAAPTNTQPCNNYPEFCNRKYSNITEVCAHNSAFDIPVQFRCS